MALDRNNPMNRSTKKTLNLSLIYFTFPYTNNRDNLSINTEILHHLLLFLFDLLIVSKQGCADTSKIPTIQPWLAFPQRCIWSFNLLKLICIPNFNCIMETSNLFLWSMDIKMHQLCNLSLQQQNPTVTKLEQSINQLITQMNQIWTMIYYKTYRFFNRCRDTKKLLQIIMFNSTQNPYLQFIQRK